MRRPILCITIFIIICFFANTPLQAQTTSSKQALSVGVIDSRLFEDPTTGIYKLTQVQKQVQQEFQPRTQAIELMRKKAQTLEAQLKQAAGKADPKQYDAYDDLQKQITNRSDDIVRLSQKRYSELMSPLQTRMAAIFKEWCQKRGYYLLLDIAKDPNGMVLLAEEGDTQKNTADLIRYMNSLL